MNNYLDILRESLVKKIEVLKMIKEATFEQKEILSKESFDMEAFDSYVDEKDGYIDELTKLDEGFDSLYKKVSKELEGNKEAARDILEAIRYDNPINQCAIDTLADFYKRNLDLKNNKKNKRFNNLKILQQ